MWRVHEVTTRPATLDLSSSGQGLREVTELVSDSIVLANAMELVSWTSRTVQARVCDFCGIEGCSSHGWVAPRWAGSHLLFLPAYERMLEGDFEQAEFRPPDYLSTRGIPVIHRSAAQKIPTFAELRACPLMTGDELVRTLQWGAPLQILGEFPNPVRVRRDLVLASYVGEASPVLDALEQALRPLATSTEPIAIQPPPEDHEPASLFLDDLGATEWTPLVRVGPEYKLALTPDLVVA